jgi:endonuclease G
VWTLSAALIGTTTSDVKSGAKAARVRNTGSLTMAFDLASGVSTVSVKHATYGADAAGTWGVYYSQNGGSSWTQAGASVVTGAALQTATFTVNRSGPVRLSLRKIDGTSSRIDLDDVRITDFGGEPPGGGTDPDPTPGAALSVHTTLGIPAAASTSDWKRYLSVKSAYVMSYDSSRKVPNWVSWELNSSYLGNQSRLNNYRSDDTLPSGMPQAYPSDYSGSGYDRGHLCPSGDRTASATANGQTFYLSNMVPQAGNNNSGPWEKLEVYTRTLATQGKEIFVVAGGVFASSPRTIGNGVAVPGSTFKVIVALDGEGAASAVTTSARVIGVVMPNDDRDIAAADDWRSFRVSVDAIEAITGFDFLSDVDKSVQSVVESRVDTQ